MLFFSLVGRKDECMSNEHELRRDKRSQSVVPQYQRRKPRYKQLELSTLLGTVRSCLILKTTRVSFFSWVIFRVHIMGVAMEPSEICWQVVMGQ